MVNVLPSGRIHVIEAIRFRFTGSWNGVYRDIPVRYETPQRFNYDLDLRVGSVLDEDGQPFEYEESRKGQYKRIKIWVPGASDKVRTIHIEYSVENALRFIDAEDSDFDAGHDELYWNVTGDEWEIPIHAVTARVLVPPEVTGLAARVYTGALGSTSGDATATEIESGFYFVTGESLGAREGMTISMAWAPGVIARPASYVTTVRFFSSNWIFLLPILTLIVMYRLWDARGRDPSRMAITPQYKPPDGMTPAEIGTLIDNSPHMRDITASIVDLAVRGYLKIEEREQTGLAGWLKGNTYSFELLKESEEWSELTPHERKLLSGMFEGALGNVVDLDDLENEFYKHMPAIEDGIFNRLMVLGYYYRRPDKGPECLRSGRYRGSHAIAVGIRVRWRELRGLLFSAGRNNHGWRSDRDSDHRVRHGHARPNDKGRSPVGARPRIPGVSRPGRSGPFPAHDRFARDVRAVPSARDGAPGREEVGPSLRGFV